MEGRLIGMLYLHYYEHKESEVGLTVNLFDAKKLVHRQEKGMLLAPTSKMRNIIEEKPENSAIRVLDPPIQGSPCLSVFNIANKFFASLINGHKYVPESPGKPAENGEYLIPNNDTLRSIFLQIFQFCFSRLFDHIVGWQDILDLEYYSVM